MAKARGGMSLSHMREDDGSEDEVLMPTPDSARENIEPGKRNVGKPKSSVTKAAKPTAAARRTAGASVAEPSKVKKTKKRTVLAERTNMQEVASNAEEVDDFVEEQGQKKDQPENKASVSKQAGRRGRPPKPRKDADIPPPNVEKSTEPLTCTQQETPEMVRQSKFAPKSTAMKKPKVSKRAPSPAVEKENVVPETQPEPMELDPLNAAIEDAMNEPSPKVIDPQAYRARSISKQRRPSVVRKRGGSASDTERNTGSDPLLRRKLGEMTKKFEALELKYQNLRDIGIRDAEANFEKLKRQSDEKTRDAEALISSLRVQIKTQAALASESKTLRTQISNLTSHNQTLTSENKSLSTALAEANAQNQALSAKLAALRTASSNIQSTSDTGANTSSVKNTSNTKGPGSAAKSKTIMVGSAEAAKDAAVRQLKEDLYSDLTGLIIRGVKREGDGDVYDCLQTGRNGTLHFHLTLTSPPPSAPSASQATSYDDAEFAYTPLLDQNRDRELLEILPDYLAEEICFPRSSAGRFYARVVDCLVKRREAVEEVEEEE